MYQYIAYPFDAFIDVTILLLLIAFISFIDRELKKGEALKNNCPIVLSSFANKNKSFIKFVRKH